MDVYSFHGSNREVDFTVQVKAVDADVDDAAKITYTIYDSDGTRASTIFDIDATTGELFLKESAIELGILNFDSLD